MKHFSKKFLAPCLALGALLMSSPAWADATVPISGNTSFNIDYSLFVPGSGGFGPITLSATSTWTVTNFTSTSLDLAIYMQNTTVLGTGYTRADMVSFGFNGDPTITLDKPNSTFGLIFIDGGSEVNLPSIDNSIDVCVWAGNSCPGGSNEGLGPTESDTLIKLHLTYADPGQLPLILNTFGTKWQTSNTSYHFTGCLQGDEDCNPNVPEPGSMLLMFGGLGLMLAGYRRYIN